MSGKRSDRWNTARSGGSARGGRHGAEQRRPGGPLHGAAPRGPRPWAARRHPRRRARRGPLSPSPLSVGFCSAQPETPFAQRKRRRRAAVMRHLPQFGQASSPTAGSARVESAGRTGRTAPTMLATISVPARGSGRASPSQLDGAAQGLRRCGRSGVPGRFSSRMPVRRRARARSPLAAAPPAGDPRLITVMDTAEPTHASRATV